MEEGILCSFAVASYVEAWIEIDEFIKDLIVAYVASYVEAWIEICKFRGEDWKVCVASYVEAWIEINWRRLTLGTIASLPTWKRGLKSEKC